MFFYDNINTGDRTPKGKEISKHVAEQANKRKYSPEDVDNIIDNWTDKGYQPGGKTVFVKKQSYGRDIVVIDKNGKSIVSVIRGNGKKGVPNTLQSMDDVKKMMKNQGGFYTMPMY